MASSVPKNQSQSLAVASSSGPRYRGERGVQLDARTGDRCVIPRGREQIVFHHGMAYACAVARLDLLVEAQAAVDALVIARNELFSFSLDSLFYGACTGICGMVGAGALSLNAFAWLISTRHYLA